MWCCRTFYIFKEGRQHRILVKLYRPDGRLHQHQYFHITMIMKDSGGAYYRSIVQSVVYSLSLTLWRRRAHQFLPYGKITTREAGCSTIHIELSLDKQTETQWGQGVLWLHVLHNFLHTLLKLREISRKITIAKAF